MEAILSRHNVAFGFVADLPDEVLYTYLVEDCIPNESVGAAVNVGFTLTLDGCDGRCPGCFQEPYCATAREVWKDE